MQTREELLNGLNDAVLIIRQLANIQQRLNQVRSKYRNTVPHKKIGKLAKVFLAIMLIACIMPLVQINITGLVFGIVKFVIAFVIIKFIYKSINEGIDKDNAKIVSDNENTKIQEQNVLNDLQQVQIAYRERVSMWYPDNYCYVEAVEFFYNAVKNYRADTMKEAVNLYEKTLHERRVENNQNKMLEQQKLNNLLSAGSLVIQGMTLGEISRHNTTF